MRKTMIGVLAIATVAGAVTWRMHARRDGDKVTVENRLWIDHMPKDEHEIAHAFVLLDDTAEVGVFAAGSRWIMSQELFTYEQDGDALDITYPQTHEHVHARATARACSEQRQMDYCLDVVGAGRGVTRYYSRKGWEIDRNATVDAVDAKLRTLTANAK